MNDRDSLRELLYGVGSHVHILDGLDGLDPQVAGTMPGHGAHSIFQILGHMVYWQDIALARMRGERPPEPSTAAEGWLTPQAPEDESDWQAAIASLAEGLRSIEAMVADTSYDLDRALDGTKNRTGRGEVLMVQGHNSYHLGQIVELRRQLGSWPPPKGGDSW